MVPVEALVSTNVGEVEDGEGEARETAHVDFVGSEPSGGVDGLVLGALDVRKVDIPIGLVFAAHHGERYSHDVADALDTAVCERMVGACGNCVDAEIFIESAGEFGT